MKDYTHKPINGVPADYTPYMELTIRDEDGTEKPAMVMGRVRFENGSFVPDANGNIIEYFMDGEVCHEHVDKLNGKIVGFIPAYNLNNSITLQTPDGEVKGTVTAEENEDGLIEVQTELPIDGRVVNLFTREQLDAMMISSPSTAMYIKPQKEDKQQSANNNPKDKTSFKNKIYTWLGCGFWIILFTLIVVNCAHRYIAKRNKTMREQFVKDSLANDKHYQDSLTKANRIAAEEWKRKEIALLKHTLVITCDTDGLFHTLTQCDSIYRKGDGIIDIGTDNINAYRIISLYDAYDLGYKLCLDCEAREDADMIFGDD